MGPAHGGFEFLKGSFEGIKGYVVGRMTKSRRDKLYIDDEGWGPEHYKKIHFRDDTCLSQ